MTAALKEVDKIELVNIERLVYILKGLSPTELETLELLLDSEAATIITQSREEMKIEKGVPIDEW